IYDYLNQREETLEQIAQLLKTNPRDVLVAAEKLIKERSELQKQVQQLKSGAAGSSESFSPSEIAGVTVVTGRVQNGDGEMLAGLADRTANERKSAVIVFAGDADGKVVFVAKV